MKVATSVSKIIVKSIDSIAQQSDMVTIGESCSLEIEADGTLTLRTEHPEENSIDETIYNGVTRKIDLPSGIRPSSLAEFLRIHILDIQNIVSGMDSYWENGQNFGTLTEEAEIAMNSLVPNQFSQYPDVEVIEEVDPDEYFKTYYEKKYQSIQSQAIEEDAVTLALENLDENGIDREIEVDTRFIALYIGRREAEQYARQIWQSAQSENDNE